jgi:hypothetical protein
MRDEEFKQVEIGKLQFRLTYMTAGVASRICNQLMYSSIRASQNAQRESPDLASSQQSQEPELPSTDAEIQQRAEDGVMAGWLTAATLIPEEEYTKIQNYALRACQVYDNELATYNPVLMADGKRWTVKELERDAVTVNRLIADCLKFNIAPFFAEGLRRAATPKPVATGPAA